MGKRKRYVYDKKNHLNSKKLSESLFPLSKKILGDKASLKILRDFNNELTRYCDEIRNDCYSKYNIEISDGDIYCGIVKAIPVVRKIKKYPPIVLIKASLKRAINEIRKKEYRRNYVEILTDPTLLEELTPETLCKMKNLSRDDKDLWVEEAADYLGVSPSTLRSWDKKGLYTPKWVEKEGKRYRKYPRADLPLLRNLKETNLLKKRGKNYGVGYIKDLSEYIEVPMSTIRDNETAGLIPLARRDNKNYRVYTIKEMKEIKKLIGSKDTLEEKGELDREIEDMFNEYTDIKYLENNSVDQIDTIN